MQWPGRPRDHDACAVTSPRFAFVNRIADGLGVELEAPPAAGA
ncbi:MAG: hypothetical protein R2745_12785 [Vicinamibacterales bacterium]